MNFNIVDGNRDYMDLLPKFVELYNNPEIRTKKILSQLSIGIPEYRKLRREAVSEGLITLRKQSRKKKKTCRTNPKYYSHHVTKGIEYYHVQKHINGKLTHFATFKDARHAKRMVELLKECDWDKSMVEVLKERVLNES